MINFKTLVLAGAFAAVLPACSVAPECSSAEAELILPALPPAWEALFGEAAWRIRWVGPDGAWHSMEAVSGDRLSVPLDTRWATPILAYPYWPSFGIMPEVFKPAGAIVPLDLDAWTVRLNWRGGVEAQFYRELALRCKGQRRPENFNWPRFRELLRENPDEEIARDPWLVDWRIVARGTAASGFNKNRVSRGEKTAVTLTVPPGDGWAGDSPFFAAIFDGAAISDGAAFPPEGSLVELQAGDSVSVFVSTAGILKLSKDGALWLPWPQQILSTTYQQ